MNELRGNSRTTLLVFFLTVLRSAHHPPRVPPNLSVLPPRGPRCPTPLSLRPSDCWGQTPRPGSRRGLARCSYITHGSHTPDTIYFPQRRLFDKTADHDVNGIKPSVVFTRRVAVHNGIRDTPPSMWFTCGYTIDLHQDLVEYMSFNGWYFPTLNFSAAHLWFW